MPCTQSVIEGGPLVVWTNVLTASYHALSAPLDSASVVKARANTYMANRTANCEVKLAVRYSNDGISWDAWVDVSGAPAQSTDGWQNDLTWRDLTTGVANIRRYVQLGFKVSVTAGGSVMQMAAMSWAIETKDA